MKGIILLLGVTLLMLTGCAECGTSSGEDTSFKINERTYTKHIIQYKGHSYLLISSEYDYTVGITHLASCKCQTQTQKVDTTEEYEYTY